MVRYTPLGNGRLLIAFDTDYRIVDFYYSKYASENHSSGHPFYFGVSVDGNFRWIDRNAIKHMDYYDHTMVSVVNYSQNGIDFENRDMVDIYKDVFIRRVVAENKTAKDVDLKLFFHQNFYIYGNDIGDTAAYFPEYRGVIHYKGGRYFLASTLDESGNFCDQYATGVKDVGELKGTWKDAEDNELSMNPVAIGSVDSVIRHSTTLKAGSKFTMYYFIIAGRNINDIENEYSNVNVQYLQKLLRRTTNYWELWSSKVTLNLDSDTTSLYRRSLFVTKSHANDLGAIAASCDSDILKLSHDGYYYVWPRDASMAAYALSISGHSETARRYFALMEDSLSEEGYLYHKYNVDGKIASSWLPHVMNGKSIYPIQEDETALVVWALWEYFRKYNDIGFTAPYYERLITRAADFMTSFVDSSGLPKPSFDLWEERYGIHAYTVATVYAALKAASSFANVFGDPDLSEKYDNAADRMYHAFDEKFYSDDLGYYARAIIDGKPDFTVDSALSSLVLFGMKDADDPKVISTMQRISEDLWINGVGGIARYQNDRYMRVKDDPNVPGNPWIITTLWMARYYMRFGDFEKAWNLIQWVKSHRQKSGIFSEQINPYNGEPLSVSPLVWSHAEFIISLIEYSDLIRKRS
ncbi:glycoside hydrolase family 15 protein [Thermoplasma sp.]|uniref:glycoside hydrolase family 15 protein n=1 Tax=Thermoplasma sp. TaxID=1973142 RepID=UPI00126E681C|nr:glycoside hydrolase family 15 protein [Thermoplasma sp.]KAA8922793.1 MAG: glycoside hydrolase family 15 protein [Thermoplasma sp.]